MCGIAGFFDARGHDPTHAQALALRMADAIAHRGPDDHGAWADPAGVALGHRRLSILDLSPTGHQPMASASGRYQVVFNGEIYNFAALRAELAAAGTTFRGHSDTEVMLAVFERDGVAAALPRLRGMFALAVWDRQVRRLILARDRLGEKPLYYGWIDGGRTLVFGSELAALRAHPGWDGAIDRGSLVRFLRYSFVPHPRSIYVGIHKLPPGSWIELDATTRDAQPERYYSLTAVAEAGVARPLAVELDGAADQLERELLRAVGEQLVADVPVGAFLSGGIDSSTIVALMQRANPGRVRTFSIGFAEAGYDEAPHARAVAAHLGTDHTEVYLTPAETQAVVPDLARIYDEPFADSSQIPTFLVSRVARAHVTVALTGDGGDELFGGYPRYRLARRMHRLLGVPGRHLSGATLHRALGRLIDDGRGASWWQRRLDWARRRTALVATADDDDFYALFMSLCFEPERFVPGTAEPRGTLPLSRAILAAGNVTERAMLADGLQYLPDDILAKVDRAAMAVSLETRVPLLDPGVVATAWSLPFATKVVGDQGKVVLRRVLARYVPPALFERPKMGFAVPLATWLRGPLRAWAEALLEPARLRREGFLDATIVRRRWDAYLAGVDDWQYTLWNVLMWQAWYERSRTCA